MILKEVLKKGRSFLNGSENALLNAEVLLCEVLGKQREYLISHCDEEVSGDFEQKYYTKVREVQGGRPLAYVLSRKEFYGNDFFVDENVLIPRPETELLIDEVLYRAKKLAVNSKRVLKILDVGTGSGNIALSLALLLSNAEITAVDVSKKALGVAKKNYERLSTETTVEFFESDLFEGIPEDKLREGFDIIVANLPYIGLKSNNFVQEEVKNNEPSHALFSGDDGLYDYRRFFDAIGEMEWQPKYIIGEYGFKPQEKELKQIVDKIFCSKMGVNFYKDLAGNPRMFVVSKKN